MTALRLGDLLFECLDFAGDDQWRQPAEAAQDGSTAAASG